jgi:hypothetical protein
MNRAEKRRQAKEVNTPQKLDMLEKHLRWAIRKECQEEADERIKTFIQSYTTLVTYVLWYKFGMGKKRIAKFADELRNHLDILEEEKKYGLTLDDMYKELKKKAKIDLQFLDDGNKIDKK